MPTPTLDEPITKVTLNLWSSDHAELKRIYGDGWSSRVREIIRKHLRQLVYQQRETVRGKRD